jgi:hypothetical protein
MAQILAFPVPEPTAERLFSLACTAIDAHCKTDDEAVYFVNRLVAEMTITLDMAQSLFAYHNIPVVWNDEPEPQGAA